MSEDDDNMIGMQLCNDKQTGRASLIDLYYRYFHAAQPCVLPQHILQMRLRDVSTRIEDLDSGMHLLQLVIQFIGSLYCPSIASDPLEKLVKSALAQYPGPADGFEVQALLLYSISVHWCGDIQRSNELLAMATSKALALGMNHKEFATDNAPGNPVLAESWRRTWWQLYLTDAHIASSLHEVTFGTSQRTVLATVELPCEETEYHSGVSLASRTPHCIVYILT
jgi:hypothetical protein